MLASTLAALGYPLRRQILIAVSRTLTTQDVNAILQVDSAAAPRTVSLMDGDGIGAGGYFYVTAPFGTANPVTVIFPAGNTYNQGKVGAVTLSNDDDSILIVAGPGKTWNVFFGEASGANAGVTSNYVYRPGDPNPGGNVFADWAALMTQVGNVPGPKIIEVDDTIVSPAPAPIPAGAWDLNDSTLMGRIGGQQTVLRGAVGTTLTNLSHLDGTIQLQSLDPAVPLIALTAVDVFDLTAGASVASIGGGPVFGVAGVGTAILRLYASSFPTLGLGPAVDLSGGAGTSLLIQMWEGSDVGNDVITSAVGSIVTAQMRSSASSFSRDQSPGMAGALAFSYFVPDQQTVAAVGGGGTLPILGYAAITGDVLLPFALQTQGPIHVENRDSVPHSVSAQAGDSVDAGLAKMLPPGAVCVFKSNGLLAWITEEKTFVNYDAAGMPIPTVPDVIDFGSRANQWRVINNRLDVRVGPTQIPGFINPPTLTYSPSLIGEIAVACVGYGAGNCVVEALNDVTAFIQGRVNNFDAGGSVSALRSATRVGFVAGGVYMYGGGVGDVAEIDLQAGVGSEIGGYAIVTYQAGSAIIRNLAGSGGCRTRAYALVNPSSPAGAIAIIENSGFNDVFVAAYHEARVYARPGSSVFRGTCVGLHAGQYALMENVQDAFACFIHARVQTVAGYNAIARTEDEAGWVTGRTNGGLLETRAGVACWVRGFAAQGATIYAQGNGSTAWGNAAAGQTIGVAASNADQWGVGINTLADSTRFGVGWRFKKTALAPGAPANGDCWIGAGGSLYVHTNGVTKNLDNIV